MDYMRAIAGHGVLKICLLAFLSLHRCFCRSLSLLCICPWQWPWAADPLVRPRSSSVNKDTSVVPAHRGSTHYPPLFTKHALTHSVATLPGASISPTTCCAKAPPNTHGHSFFLEVSKWTVHSVSLSLAFFIHIIKYITSLNTYVHNFHLLYKETSRPRQRRESGDPIAASLTPPSLLDSLSEDKAMRCNYFNWLWLLHLHDKCMHILGNSGLLLRQKRPLGQRGTLGFGALRSWGGRWGDIAGLSMKSHSLLPD